MGTLSSEDQIENDLRGIYSSSVMVETSPRHRPRRSFHRSSSTVSPCVNHRRSFSYDKLPDFHLQLTVIKLDGSSFEVEIRKTAKIVEIKKAIEKVFNRLPAEEPGKISWPQVWGHFCLSYGDQKLLNDTANVRDYGVQDGDELHFVRHLSLDTLTKKRSTKRMDASKTYTIIENDEEEEQPQDDEDSYDLEDDPKLQPRKTVEDNSTNHESEKRNLFGRSQEADAILRSRVCGGGVFWFLRRLCLCCGNRSHTCSSRVSQVEI